MNELAPEDILAKVPQLDQLSHDVSRGIHDAVLKGGKPTRTLADLLHGTWLGHQLHPVLTDVTLGAWAFGSLLDLWGMITGKRTYEKAGDTLIEIGTASALPTALAGIADYSTIGPRAMKTGLVHGVMNITGFLVYLGSIFARRSGSRQTGNLLSGMGLGMLLVSGWLGGELAFKYKVGVNKTPTVRKPEEWTAVMAEADLHESMPIRIEVEGSPVLLYRYGGTVYAASAVCGHDGGPLDEGTFDGTCVECPWHQSVYDLKTGSVVHGPTTYALPTYDTRIKDGQVELRLSETH